MVNSSYFLGLHVTSHLPQIADAMSSNMAAPYKTLFNFGNIENFELQLLHQNYD